MSAARVRHVGKNFKKGKRSHLGNLQIQSNPGDSLIALMLCGYVYVVSATALNVMAGREADAHAATLEGRLGALQQRYYSLARAISAESAVSLGLAPVAETDYVYRPSTVGIVYTGDNAN